LAIVAGSDVILYTPKVSKYISSSSSRLCESYVHGIIFLIMSADVVQTVCSFPKNVTFDAYVHFIELEDSFLRLLTFLFLIRLTTGYQNYGTSGELVLSPF
jgi:hypothetical protein